MSLHTPHRAAALRAEGGGEFVRLIEARDAFWVDAWRAGEVPRAVAAGRAVVAARQSLDVAREELAKAKARAKGAGAAIALAKDAVEAAREELAAAQAAHVLEGGKYRALACTRLRAGDPMPADALEVARRWGAGPGRWGPGARALPSWRAFLRARDVVLRAHLALCHALTARAIAKVGSLSRAALAKHIAEHGELPKDVDRPTSLEAEDVWQAARLLFCDRAVELYDPAKPNPKAPGKFIRFSTYAAPWVKNAVFEWRRQRFQDRARDGGPVEDALGA